LKLPELLLNEVEAETNRLDSCVLKKLHMYKNQFLIHGGRPPWSILRWPKIEANGIRDIHTPKMSHKRLKWERFWHLKCYQSFHVTTPILTLIIPSLRLINLPML